MLIYRASAPFRGIKHHPLEVLCLGQQFVAYATHPDTGVPYAWPEEGLADLDITDLPEITGEAAAAFLEEAYAILPEALRQRGLRVVSPTAEHLRSHSQIGTLPAIKAALEWLPNAELDYDSWMRIGMALKGALGEARADVFADWSAQAAKDVSATTAKAWASFKPDRIGAGTIYHLAMERGWQPAGDLRLDGSIACDGAHPAAGLLSRLGVQSDHDVGSPVSPPFTLVMPDGLVGNLTEYMLTTARRPQPLLSLGATGGVIDLLRDRAFTASGLGAFTSGWFTFGTLEWTSGANAGRRTEVLGHDVTDGIAVLTLLEAPVRAIAEGDAFTIRAGCDKRMETCGAKFANTANFRGFPHIPGQDAVLRYATKDGGHEGSVL